MLCHLPSVLSLLSWAITPFTVGRLSCDPVPAAAAAAAVVRSYRRRDSAEAASGSEAAGLPAARLAGGADRAPVTVRSQGRRRNTGRGQVPVAVPAPASGVNYYTVHCVR